MKKLLMTVMALSCFAFSSYGQKKVEKQIIGKWCNPYTYESTGELKGFEFKKGGKCSAINVPSLDLRTWKIDEDGYLIIEGFSKEDDGKIEVYKTRERIGYVTAAIGFSVSEYEINQEAGYSGSNSRQKVINLSLNNLVLILACCC